MRVHNIGIVLIYGVFYEWIKYITIISNNTISVRYCCNYYHVTANPPRDDGKVHRAMATA